MRKSPGCQRIETDSFEIFPICCCSERLRQYRLGHELMAIRAHVNRFSKNESSNVIFNADMFVGEVRQFYKWQAESQNLMRVAMSQLNLSVHAYATQCHRILNLARTIADLARVKKSNLLIWQRRYILPEIDAKKIILTS